MSHIRLFSPICFSATLQKGAFTLLLLLIIMITPQRTAQHALAAPTGIVTVTAHRQAAHTATSPSKPDSIAMATPFNNALNFDGENDIVDLGNIGVLNGVSQYTIETWVKFETFSVYGTVFAKRVGDTDRAAMLQVWDESGNIAVAVNNGYGYTSEPLNTGTWYHIAVVYDGAQTSDAERLKLYVNGSPKLLSFLNEVPAVTPTTESRFTLGAEYNGTTPVDADSTIAVPFDGTIDELRIWNFARTQPQIQADKYRELTGSEVGLEAYYDFNQGIPQGDNAGLITLNDKAGETAENGTLWNFALIGSASNWVGNDFILYRQYLPMLMSVSE
jgi:hypothetical protein